MLVEKVRNVRSVADAVIGAVFRVPHGLQTGGVEGEEVGWLRGLAGEFVGEVEGGTGEGEVAEDARGAVELGGFGGVLGGLGFKFLYWVEGEELVSGGIVRNQGAEEGDECGFGVDGSGNKFAAVVLHPGRDD